MGFVFLRKDVARRVRRQQPFAGDGPARPARLHGEDRRSGASRRRRTWWSRWPRRCASSTRRAASRRGWRATPQLQDAGRRHGGARLQALPRPEHPGADHRHLPCAGAIRRYDFKRFYEAAKQRGFILYPGKLTEVETFRVGCIGAIGRNEMKAGGGRGRRRAAGDRHRQRHAEPALPARSGHSGAQWRHDARPPPNIPRSTAVRKSGSAQGQGRRAATSTASCAASTCTRTSSSARPSRAERRLRLLRRGLRLGLRRPVPTTTRTLTGWQHGFPDALARLDLDDPAQRAVGRQRAVLPRRVRQRRRQRRSPICPRQTLKRVLDARREAGLRGDGRHGVRVVQLPRDAAELGRQAGRRPRRR